jgi:hypothetical protein
MKQGIARVRIFAAVVACAVALMLPLTAHASGPVSNPATVVADGFESTPAGYTVTQLPWYDQASPAVWAPVSQWHRSGSYGLWCAGSLAGQTSYPLHTSSYARWLVPALADYYSSSLSFWYVMPSVGAGDAEGLMVAWKPANTSDAEDSHKGLGVFPLTSTWRNSTWSLTATSNATDLSRQAGALDIVFTSQDPGFYNGTATTGQGPTIDDLLVTGWKFGPAQNLALGVNGTTAHLRWDTPAASTVTAAIPDDRPIAYRVYRAPNDGKYAWVERTSGSITATSFDDDMSGLSGSYLYAVQAEDQLPITDGSDVGYSQLVVSDPHTFTLGAGAPVFTITGLPVGGLTKSSVTASCTTTETAAYSMVATLDGAPYTLGTQQVSTDGTHTLTVHMTTSAGASEQTVSFFIDTTKPVTTNNAPSGTQLAAVKVTLTASDAGSGVAHTYYLLDSATKTATLYTVPIPVSWGDHTLYYYSVDVAGNVEVQKSVKLSLRQPTTISIAASPSTGTHRHTQTLYGYISPGTRSYKVKVQYQRPYSTRWYTAYVYTITSGSKGKWSYRYVPMLKGTYHWKASWAGNSTRYTSTSRTLSVKVK